MSLFSADLARLAQWPTSERLLALERIIPLDTVQAVLRQTGHARRHYARLPAWFVVWFVLALGLFRKDSYRHVFKHLQRFRPGGTPGRNTLCEARKGLGIAPLRLLADQVVRLLAQPDTRGAFYKGLRLVALDGFVLNLPDTPANARVFGRPQSGRAAGAFPQCRVLALCETGTHVLYKWLVKPICRGEVSMAPYVLRWLEQDMLLLWDRNFLSFKQVQLVLAKKAHLLARIKSHLVFTPVQELPDGSYLAKLYPSPWHRGKDRQGIVVRIIEYTLTDPTAAPAAKVQRLLTTLLDARTHPAAALVELYHERWEEELTIDELKTHQGDQLVLRSGTPQGVVQEVQGLLLGHYLLRVLMYEAAQTTGAAPRQMSFVGTLKILRCRLAEAPRDPGDVAGRQRWWEELLAEIAEEELLPRRHRINPRVIKRKMSKWPKKRPHHRRPPQPTKPFRESIVIT